MRRPIAPTALTTLDHALRGWLIAGLLALLLLPAARGHHLWIGWLPFWLLVWPACSLALLHRQRLAARWARRARRPRPPRCQARRPAAPARRLLLAALRLG
jgi:hypothetical protein